MGDGAKHVRALDIISKLSLEPPDWISFKCCMHVFFDSQTWVAH